MSERNQGLSHVRERIEYRLMLGAKALRQRLKPSRPQQVVFVAGMQRSGTNMLMDRIERSFETDVFHERDPRAFDNYQMRDLETIDRLVADSRAPHFVIKALCELDQLDALMQHFAPARTVWIVRDYRDAVRSALVSFGNFARQVARIAENRHVDDWRAGGMTEETHQLVRRLNHEGLSEASAAALIWYFRNLLFFQQGFDQDPRVHLVSYEALVQAPEAVCAGVFAFLGIPFSERITQGVFASSIRRKPVEGIEPAIASLCESLMSRFQACQSKPNEHV